MIAKKKIEALPVLPAKAKGDDKWIGRIRMHEETIVMDVYDARYIMCPEAEEKDAVISFRWVCDKKNYYTYNFESKTWTDRGMHWAMYGYDGCCYNLRIKLDKKSEQIAKGFLDGIDTGWIYSRGYVEKLRDLENHIRDERRKKAEEQRYERIEKRQKKRKQLPKDWDGWLKSTVYREERYLFYDAKKRKQGICAYCGETVELDGKQKHNSYAKCPACGSRIQYKALKKTQGRIEDSKQAIYLQKTEEGFLTRYVMTNKISTVSGEKYSSYEVVLATYDGKKTWYDYCYTSGYTGREFWEDKRQNCFSAWKAEGYLYTKNAKQAVKDTVFKYAPLREWMQHEGKSIEFCDFMKKYETSPFIEFFVKAGLFNLTRSYIHTYEKWHGSKPQEILGINRQRISRLIKMDGGIIALKWLQYEEQENIRIPDEIVKWMQDNNVRADAYKAILEGIGSVIRMVNYIKKQTVPPDEVAVTWTDYLRMAAAEGLDTTDDIVRFPKDLRLRHDQLVDLQNRKNDEKRLSGYVMLDEQIKRRIPEVERYFWENDKYIIVPAAKCEELMTEGRTLHHCVGRDDHYMKKMATGESWILFLRKKEEIETPYYTIEINMRDDRILQWYSAFDRKPDAKEIEKVLETFKRNVKKKRNKVLMQVATTA